MVVFALWSPSLTGGVSLKPRPGAVRDWWAYCERCKRLSGPHQSKPEAREGGRHECPGDR